jgi:hypothetical protein
MFCLLWVSGVYTNRVNVQPFFAIRTCYLRGIVIWSNFPSITVESSLTIHFLQCCSVCSSFQWNWIRTVVARDVVINGPCLDWQQGRLRLTVSVTLRQAHRLFPSSELPFVWRYGKEAWWYAQLTIAFGYPLKQDLIASGMTNTRNTRLRCRVPKGFERETLKMQKVPGNLSFRVSCRINLHRIPMAWLSCFCRSKCAVVSAQPFSNLFVHWQGIWKGQHPITNMQIMKQSK